MTVNESLRAAEAEWEDLLHKCIPLGNGSSCIYTITFGATVRISQLKLLLGR